MTTFIYGTSNTAKLASMRKTLAPLDIEVIGLNENGVVIPDVAETGNTPLENARIKALAYYELLKRPVFACDSGLYIEGLSDDEQPGVHVRTVNGKRLSDDEMIAYYSAIAKRLGRKAIARYSNAICLVMSDEKVYEHFGDDISYEPFYLTDTPHAKRIPGFPLDCLSVNIKTRHHYYDDENQLEDVGIAPNGFQAFFQRVLLQEKGII